MTPPLVTAAGGTSMTVTGSGFPSSVHFDVRLSVYGTGSTPLGMASPKAASPSKKGVAPPPPAPPLVTYTVPADVVNGRTLRFSSPRMEVGEGALIAPGMYKVVLSVGSDGGDFETTTLMYSVYGASDVRRVASLRHVYVV